MTDQEIIEKLATEFMGWQFTDDTQVIGEHWIEGVTSTVWFRREGGSIGVTGAVTCSDFDPLHDPAACALVKAELRRRDWWYTITYANEFACRLYNNGRQEWMCFVANEITEERAVCLAVLEALSLAQA